MENTDTLVINQLPAKTWYWLDVNDAKIPWNQSEATSLDDTSYTAAAGETLVCPRLSVTGDASDSQKQIHIQAEAGSKVTLVTDYLTTQNLSGTTDISLRENAEVTLIQIYDGAKSSMTHHVIKADCEKDSTINIIQVVLGRGDTYLDHQIELSGDQSKCNIDIGYLGQDSQHIDVNIVSNHYGSRTQSSIQANGVLKDAARKTFRGTIDFKKGAVDSVGNEQETVLMLGEDVVNKTIPLILCAEENVIGNHGATIGELDEETLFYFASRGIDRDEAEAIMAKAAVCQVIARIADEETRESALTKLQELLGEEP